MAAIDTIATGKIHGLVVPVLDVRLERTARVMS